MDFLDLDTVLPFYVDYLGRFEYDKEEKILNATDALSELLHSGVQEKVYVKNAEFNFTEDRLILTNAERVRTNFSINTILYLNKIWTYRNA